MNSEHLNYKIIQTIKKSEKAEVYFAALKEYEKPVIVKHLFGANPDIYHVIGNIRNSHIPQIYAVEEREDYMVVVEEYVGGLPLDEYLAENRLGDTQMVELLMQLCDAIEALHCCTPPVIHRDIKPSNILIDEKGLLKIIDFDASRQYKGEKNTSDTRLLGTVEYAAPEQFGFAQTDPRSDIYSMGVVFSELTFSDKCRFSKEWKKIVDCCTSFDPVNRYKSIFQLKKDLQRCITLSKYPILARQMITGSLLFLCAGCLFLGGWILVKEVIKSDDRGKETVQTGEPTPGTGHVTPETDGTDAPGRADSETEHSAEEQVPGVVLVEDTLSWNENGLPIKIKVHPNEECKISRVYTCNQLDGNDPFSEALLIVWDDYYTLEENGKTLSLGLYFFSQDWVTDDMTLYIEFDDGRGERVWLQRETTEK